MAQWIVIFVLIAIAVLLWPYFRGKWKNRLRVVKRVVPPAPGFTESTTRFFVQESYSVSLQQAETGVPMTCWRDVTDERNAAGFIFVSDAEALADELFHNVEKNGIDATVVRR